MADAAFGSVLAGEIAVRDAARFFVRAVGPGDVADGGGRAGFDALRVAVAEEALGRFVFFVVEAHHVPRASLFAEVAADEAFLDNHAGARLRVNLNSALRAGIGTGHRVRALAAGVLNNEAVAVHAERGRNGIGARRPEHDVAGDLDAGEAGRGFAVVEFRAGELTAVAGNAQIGVGDDEALGRFENHVRPHAGFGSRIV